MKSNVKAGLVDTDLARLRARVLAALGLGGALVACKSSPDEGLVMAPMAESAPSALALATDASAEASTAHRPMTEPHAPSGQSCSRDVHCVDALAQAPSWPYAQPYEKCDPAPLGETGHFSANETSQRRKDDPNTCCYVSFDGCARHSQIRRPNVVVRGRPLRDVAGDAVLADSVPSKGWARAVELAPNPDEVAFWLESATAEHASVAEFARLSLALLALGAPAELVADVHRAALDEVEHASTCFSIASRFAGRELGPGPLDVSRALATASASLEELVECTVRDGCIGEGAAAIELETIARAHAGEPFARDVMKMGDDEARHAELAWRILAFALAKDEAATLRAAVAGLAPRNALEARVCEELVRPLLNELVTPRPPREGDCARGA
jgi:hypothetical protein